MLELDWELSKTEESRVSPGFWSSTMWLIELFTKMVIRKVWDSFRDGEISSSERCLGVGIDAVELGW